MAASIQSSTRGFGKAILVCAALTILLLLQAMAYAHEDYAPWCCNGDGKTGDCQRISSKLVKPVDGGWSITLRPGDYRLVTQENHYSVRQQDARPSKDGEFHACLFPSEHTMRCFYAPPMGF